MKKVLCVLSICCAFAFASSHHDHGMSSVENNVTASVKHAMKGKCSAKGAESNVTKAKCGAKDSMKDKMKGMDKAKKDESACGCK